MNKHLTPLHINAIKDDLAGNNGIGRYILLPGSDGRAKEIAQFFDNLIVKSHPRGHNLYIGTIIDNGKKIDVASIASGMGCPSIEIILHELFHLGAKRFLRLGSAGSLQPKLINVGDFVNAQSAVRDEHTTIDYAPIELPAVASFEFTSHIVHAAKKLNLSERLHSGTVHCKSSFYAREFGEGPKADENKSYLNILKQFGVLATEMETSALFIQSQLYNYELSLQGHGREFRVLAGAILGILSVPPHSFAGAAETNETITHLIALGFETIKTLANSEMDQEA